ncbi:MAG: hypothetical protein FWD16_07015 [Clostridia bacterium]|nr:hypothetical protein [Clostridia bacterium]
MKKTIAILLVLMLSMALLAGCGRNTEKPSNPPDPTSAGNNTPAGSSEETVTINLSDHGSISIKYPGDGSFTLDQQEYASDSELLSNSEKLIKQNQNPYPIAILKGNDFNIALGYYTYSGGYEEYKDYAFNYMSLNNPAEIQYDGLDGLMFYDYYFGYVFMLFPEPSSENYMRMLALYTNDAKSDEESGMTVAQLTELFESQKAQDIINTLTFGEN